MWNTYLSVFWQRERARGLDITCCVSFHVSLFSFFSLFLSSLYIVDFPISYFLFLFPSCCHKYKGSFDTRIAFSSPFQSLLDHPFSHLVLLLCLSKASLCILLYSRQLSYIIEMLSDSYINVTILGLSSSVLDVMFISLEKIVLVLLSKISIKLV